MTETDIRRILGDPTTDISMWQVAWAGDEVVGSVQPAIFAADNAAAGVSAAGSTGSASAVRGAGPGSDAR